MELSKRYKEKVNLLYRDYKAKYDKVSDEYYKQNRELHKKEQFDREVLLSQFYSEMITNGETATFQYELAVDNNENGDFLKWRIFPTDANSSALHSIHSSPLAKFPSYDKMDWELGVILDKTSVYGVKNYEIEVVYKVTTDGRDVQWEKV